MKSAPKLSHNWLAKELTGKLVLPALTRLQGVVVDLGCGTQPYKNDVLSHAEEYFGLDWPKSLHLTHPHVIADLTHGLPLRDESADGILAFEVLEHLPEPALVVAEMFRVLRPGGIVLISVPFQWHVHEAPWDFYRFTCHGLEHILKSRGFERISISAKSGFWSMLVLKVNYQSLRLIRGPAVLRLVLRAMLVPLWWTGQMMAPVLDAIHKDERSTTGYLASAIKPCP